MNYDGQEKRVNNDHDLLLEIKSDTKHLVETVSNLNDAVVSHTLDDKFNFKTINDKIGWLQKGAFMILGALVLVEFILKIK